jgi:hypothetical protein
MGVLKADPTDKVHRIDSWIDLFLTHDVYIAGFGMNLCEMDFWWLVCCKKRNFPETKIYVYEAGLKDDAIKMIADCYDINFIGPALEGEDYQKYWKDITSDLFERTKTL